MFRSDEIAAWARCHLEPGTVVVSDALGCFGAVKHAGCIHQPFVTGSGPQSAQHPALTWVNTILGNVKRSLHGTYHHFNSKHLPRYLAEFSYRFSRRFSLREMLPASHSSTCERRPCRTECSSWPRTTSEPHELGTQSGFSMRPTKEIDQTTGDRYLASHTLATDRWKLCVRPNAEARRGARECSSRWSMSVR